MNLENLHIVKELDFKEVNISLKSNNIMYVTFKDDCVLDIDLQMKLLDSYNKITEGKLTRFIFLANENVTITKEARDNAILIEDISPLGASAIIVTNLAYKLIANFYLKFNKPKRPYKVFDNEQAAVEWLNSIDL